MTAHHAPALASVGSVADLLASIPALIGFYPSRSVILLAYDDITRTVGATARTDLELTRTGTLRRTSRDYIVEAMRMIRTQGADRVLCVVVDDRISASVTGAVLRALQNCARSRSVAEPDIEIADLFLVPRLAAGQRWVCRHAESGEMSDPAESVAMLTAVVEGRTIHASRDALTGQLMPEGPGVPAAQCRRAASTEAGGDPGELLTALLGAITGPGTDPLSDADVALLGGAILDLMVRDAAMALALTVVADEARTLFAELARRLRGTPRAAAATLVAASAYLHGEGPITGIALDAALLADSRYRAAHLLARALTAGLPPSDMTAVAETGFAVASRLGVRLPPRTGEVELAG
ncbi:DUF4192 domain-containing protein [Tsukamurella serpentis]